MRRAVLKIIFMVFAAPAAGIGALAHAADAEREKQVDGMRVYLGVLPSELLGPKAVAPGEHRGVPKGRGYHHVLIALFDVKTGLLIFTVRRSVTGHRGSSLWYTGDKLDRLGAVVLEKFAPALAEDVRGDVLRYAEAVKVERDRQTAGIVK